MKKEEKDFMEHLKVVFQQDILILLVQKKVLNFIYNLNLKFNLIN